MTTTAAQQVALNNALVPLEKRVEIDKCNMKINPAKTQKEPTYQVVLDALALTTYYPAFLIVVYVPEIYMHQFWFTINKKDSTSYKFNIVRKDEEIVSFIKELGHKGGIKSITKVVVDHMNQPWRTFAAIINKCLFGKITDITFQIENRDHKKQEKMYYPKFTKDIIHHFITKDKSISIRNIMFMHTTRDDSILGPMRFVSKSDDFQVYGVLLPNSMTNQQMLNFDAYKTYLAYAPVVPSKKPATKRQSSDVQIRDTPGVSVSKKKPPAKVARSKGIELLFDATLLEEAQLKKALKRSKIETTIHQAGGSSEGGNFELEVLNELKGNGDEDADDQQGDDERTKSDDEPTETDNPKTIDDEEEIQDDEFVHTPEDYVSNDDESNEVTEEEYERINEELYGDVNVSLTDVEPADKEKDDVEMTVADAPIPSFSISSDYAAKFLNFDNIPPTDIEVISMMDINVQHEVPPPTISSILSSLYPVIQQIASIPTPTITKATTSTTVVPDSETFHQRNTNLEKEVKELKDIDNSTKVISTIHSEVPKAVKEYLRSSLDDHARKQQVPKENIISSYTTALAEFDKKTTLFETMTKSKSFNKSPKQRSLFHALIELILEDEDAMNEGVAEKLKKRKPDDADKDKGPSAGLDQGLKRQKTSKDTKQSKKAKLTESSKGTSKSHPKSTSKSAQAEETVFEIGDTQGLHNLGKDIGNTDEQPVVNVDPKDWFKKLERPPTPDPEWNKVQRSDQQLYKFMEGDFQGLHLHDIEDMLILLVQNKLFNLKGDIIVHLVAALCFIYVDKLGKNRLMYSHELYKFRDDTLISLLDTLKDMANNLEMGYTSVMPRRKWSSLDKKRSHIMIKDIDR
ncbi:hypothetical protein Tco_0551382 [Tanacetum coccineum]